MKKTALILLFLTIMSINKAFSQTSGTGLGIIVGEPTGLSLKHWVSPSNAIDAGLAWSFLDNGNFHIHADYLYHMDVLNRLLNTNNTSLYAGIGGRIKLKNSDKGETDNRLGLRVPVGVVVYFPEPKLDAFLEIVPILDLTPKTDFSFNAAIGVRYFFK
jgi:hypothetical protein